MGPESLQSLTVRPNLTRYVADLFRSRSLAISVARNDLASRHGTAALGWVWNLLDPLLMLGVYWLVFGVLLAGRRPDNFLAFLAVGIFLSDGRVIEDGPVDKVVNLYEQSSR